MKCPRCNLTLQKTHYEGVEVEMCNTCWGFWLDTGELEEILANKKLTFTEEERAMILDARTASLEGSTEPAPCPRCTETMDRIHYDESVHLVIDRCPLHGIWLDTGEIKKVQAVAEKSTRIHEMLVRKLGLER